MSKLHVIRGKRLSKQRIAVLGVLSILMVALLVLAACGGDDDAPTPIPATATPRPQATATPAPTVAVPTATPRPAATATPEVMEEKGPRPISEWTAENPATLEEIEAELEKHRGEGFTWVSWGGSYQSAQRAALITPFEQKFGIAILEDSPMVYSKFRAMANVGDPEWHIGDLGSMDVYNFTLSEDLEPFDMAIVGGTFPDLLPSVQINFPYGAGGGSAWTSVLGFNTEVYPAGSDQPDSWADFFDTEKFPGLRATPANWGSNPSFALVAADPSLLETAEGRASLGGPISPEDVQRAFGKWRDLANDPKGGVVFTSFGAECPSLLINQEVVMAVCGNGRITSAVVDDGAPLALDWTAGYLVRTDMFSMPAGLKESNPNAYLLANLWAAWSSFPEINAAVSLGISYGPVNLKGAVVLGENPAYDEIRDTLPVTAANVDYAIFLDETWAGEFSDRYQEQWVTMQQGIVE